MIHYHGGPFLGGPPFKGDDVAISAWRRRHACVSFADASQIAVACELAQSVMLDNGAYVKWKAGQGRVDVDAYLAWVHQWKQHPTFDFCLIPDVIDGTEKENAWLIEDWPLPSHMSVPIWHLNESLDALAYLVEAFPRVAFGSSGEYAEIGTLRWWSRMAEAMTVACDSEGFPKAKLHGLRMLNPTIFSQFPLASADSTNVARNIGIDKAWKGPYQPMSQTTRALILMERIELHASASRWAGSLATQMNFELIG